MTYPINPPSKLLQLWWEQHNDHQKGFNEILIEAAQYGADACCAELESIPSPLGIPFGRMAGNALRAARRPKKPRLAEEALAALQHAEEGWRPTPADCSTIRCALERLQQLEEQQ